MQLRDVTDILEEEIIDALICKYELVELCDHFLELVVPAKLLEES